MLKAFRQEAGLSQEELAERAQMSVSGISALERGERKRPYPHTVRRLADALNLDEERRRRLIGATGPAARSEQPGTTIPMSRGNISAALTSLIGRERELDEVLGVLTERRLVTLTGMGGVGKSRLGHAIAERFASGAGDGAWMVDLEGLVAPEHVGSAIASACDVRGGEPIDALAGWIDIREVLIVLDGCERVLAPAARATSDLLRHCPKLRILATSQEPLKVPGETVFALRPFDVSDRRGIGAAAALFADRMGQGGARSNSAAESPVVLDICRRVEGIPLAIELAAAWAHVMSADAILDRLDDPLRLLVADSKDAVDKRRALRAALTHTHSLLDRDQQMMFRRLSVFEGGFTLDALEQVCSTGLRDPLRSLARLVDLSLVAIDPDGRYRMLDTVLRFARDQLPDDEEGPLRGGHAFYFLQLLETAAPHLKTATVEEWLDAIERDIDNIRAALAWFDRSSDASCLLRAVAALSVYWERLGPVDEGLQWIEKAVRDVEEPSEALAQALWGGARLRWQRGEGFSSFTWTPRLLDVAQEIGDVALQAIALHALGIETKSPRSKVAEDQMERAVALAREANDPHTLATVLNDSTYFGPDGMAVPSDIPRLDEALSYARETGDPALIAMILDTLAQAHMKKDELERARRYWNEMRMVTDLGRDVWLGLAQVDGVAELALKEGDPARCLALLALSSRYRDRTSINENEWFRAERRRLKEEAEAALDSAAAAAAWEEGLSWELADVVAKPLDRFDPAR